MKYNVVACGGTFDHFHKGHEAFLRVAFASGKKVIIGLTTDKYIKNAQKENRQAIQPFSIRKSSVETFLKKEKVYQRSSIVQIDDIYGSTVDANVAIDALIISENVITGGEKVNEKRKEKKLKKLPFVIVPMVYDEDQTVLSSSSIRGGGTNRFGRKYIKDEWYKTPLFITPKARALCKLPFGKLVQEVKRDMLGASETYIVGDITSTYFNKKKLPYRLAVIDFFVEREKRFNSLDQLYFPSSVHVCDINNPPGTLTPAIFSAIENVITETKKEEKYVLQVNGEEDLTVLPLLIFAPLGATIVYGQPHKGMVVITVNEMSKEKAYMILSLFNNRSTAHTRGY